MARINTADLAIDETLGKDEMLKTRGGVDKKTASSASKSKTSSATKKTAGLSVKKTLEYPHKKMKSVVDKQQQAMKKALESTKASLKGLG